MNIKILGMGCPNCQKLEENVKKALEELGDKSQIEKVTEMEEIVRFGVMSTPALVIEGEVKFSGKIPDTREIKEILSQC